MQLEQIKRALELHLPHQQIAHIFGITDEELSIIIRNNLHTYGFNVRPSSIPNSYYIEKLREDLSVEDIADELGCSRSGLYKLLKRRGINRLRL